MKLLVPTDFTEIGNSALQHALTLSHGTATTLYILHVVATSAELSEAETKLGIFASRADGYAHVTVKTIARIGNIFEDIPQVCAEKKIDMVVMGTHGLRGMQFITGGRALRIVTATEVPFIITQGESISATGYNNIIVPLDLSRNTKQKLALVAGIAKFFNSKVHLLIPNEKDEFLSKQLQNNLNYARQYFQERSIAHTAQVSDEDSSDFVDGILDFATKVNGDLIAVMNDQGSSFKLPALQYTQQVITNEHKIPVMVLNPKEVTDISIFSAYLGG